MRETSPQLSAPKVGRPTALAPDLAAQIVAAVRDGNYLETAAALVGLSRSTLFDWLRRGAREANGPYFEFSVALRRAQAEADAADLARIQLAGRGDWRAAAWRLQHRNPARYGGGPPRPTPDDAFKAGADQTSAADPCALTEDDYAEAARVLAQRQHERRAAAGHARPVD